MITRVTGIKLPKVCAVSAALILLSTTTLAQQNASPDPDQQWLERTQLIWNDQTNRMERRRFKAKSPQADRELEFTWEPEVAELTTAGRPEISGKGRLIWRKRGSPSYDKSSIASEYEGVVSNGMLNGKGMFRLQDGTSYFGTWRNNEMDGSGELKLPDGSSYSGQFVAGKRHGQGTETDSWGRTYKGSFQHGLKNGVGTYSFPNGASYQSEWIKGVESKASIERRTALLSEANAREKFAISVSTDRRTSRKFMQSGGQLTYNHSGREIAPDDRDLMRSWKGNGWLRGWAPANNIGPAFLEVQLRNNAGYPVTIQDGFIFVNESFVDRQPLLLNSSFNHGEYGTEISFKNIGWGNVEDAVARFKFSSSERSQNVDGLQFVAQIGTFDENASFGADNAIRNMVADYAAIRNGDFKCSSFALIDSCFKNIKNSGIFGNLTPHVFLSGINAQTELVGVLEYFWTDAFGARHRHWSPFHQTVSLFTIKVPESMAEKADLPAMEFPFNRPFELRTQGKEYRVPFSYSAHLQSGQRLRFGINLLSRKSSFHRFQIVLRLSNGEEFVSRQSSLHYYQPRPQW